MAEYIIQSETLDEIAHAINEKIGMQNTMSPEDMVTAIGNIQTGGGSLPSSVTEIAGGSITVATDTRADQLNIPHSMTTLPKRFAIWTEDTFDDASNTDTNFYIVNLLFSRENVVASSATFAASYAYIYYRFSDKRLSANNGNRTESQIVNYLGSNFVCFSDSTVYYQAGKTYKWIAWA